MKRAPRKGEGRPSKYTKELGKRICSRIALGEMLLHICEEKEMPTTSTVYNWLLDDDKREFLDKYRRARDAQAEKMSEEIIDISDDGTNDLMTITKGNETYNVEDREVTNRSKLRVNARQWYLSKVMPKKFGDKLDLTSGGDKLPTPILNVIQSNNGDAKDTEAK